MMRMKLAKKLIIFCMVMLSGTVLARAQSTTQGAIVGTVFDSSDAVIPTATIVVHNDGTNAELTIKADSSGLYRAPQLPPGTYTVTISAPGFSDARTSNVTVQVNFATTLDAHLKTGEANQTVEVTATAPVLNFEDSTYGGHLSNTEIENIPINNRRWSSLALLTPGATNNSDGFGLISFRAISPLLNNVEIDGADDNQAFFSEERGRTRAGYSTSQAAVREFQVNTGVYSAEYGRAVGAVINSVTKSGSNTLHGEAYFYNRKSSRAAFQPGATNTTFDAASNQYVTTPYKPSDNRNQFGFQVGGPLLKDRLFGSYSFDMFRRNFPGTAKANVPGTFFANADAALSAGQTCNYAPITGVDSKGKTTTFGAGTITTGAPGSATAAGSVANNQACLLAARLYPSYAAGATNYNAGLIDLLSNLGPVARFGNQEINTPKLDYQINGKHHVSFLYHRLRWDSPGGVQTQGTNNYAVDTFGTDFVKLDYGLAELESQFTTRLTNELRYQYGRELNNEGQLPYSSYTKNHLTGAGGVVPEVNLNQSVGFYLGSPYYSYRVAYPDERKWQIGDTANYVFGKHNLKFGEDIVHNYDLQNNLYESNGFYTYNSTANYLSDLLSGGKTCDSAGNTTGAFPCYTSVAQSFGQPILTVTTVDYGVFVQDNWKLTPRLTANLGVRYDYESLPAPFAANPAVPETSNRPSDKNNIAPRIGFAWDPYGKGNTVVHAGYGLYYGRVFNSLLLNALENTGAGVTGSSPTSQALYNFSPTTPGAPLLPGTATTLPPAGAIGPSIEYLDKNLQNPYTQQFDLAVQQAVGMNMVFSVSYLGALGRELPNYLNLNLNPASSYTINYTIAPSTAGGTDCGPAVCGTVIPVRVYANRLQTGASASASNYSPLLNPAYNGVTAVVSNLNSSYHALTAELQKRQNKYLSFDVHYTWSHALDFNQTNATAFTAGQNNWFDPYGNARANYGNSLLNTPNRVVAWALLNVPGVSPGSRLRYIANGWTVKPLLQYSTGLSYSILVTGNAPNQCGSAGCLIANGGGLSGTGVTYIPALGRNTRTYPGTVINDLRLEKDFTFAEKYNLQLIGEAFNLPNHRNITGINTTAYSIASTIGATAGTTTSQLQYQPSFGSVTNANSNNAYQPRQIQLAMRLVF